MRRNEEGALAEIRDTGKLSDENVERLQTRRARVPAAASTASDGSSVVPKEEQDEALDEDEVDQETVKVNKPAPGDETRS